MKAGLKAIAILLALALTLSLMPTEIAADNGGYGDYHAGDIAVINAIIDNNGLNWERWDSGTIPPASWGSSRYTYWTRPPPYTFYRLYQLDVSDSNLTGAMDVSGLSKLRWLRCFGNQLTSLDTSGLSELDSLRCSGNRLTSLDISDLSELGILDFSDNQLSSLDISNLSKLEILHCSGNQLTGLDLSGQSELWSLRCSGNRLTSLDLSNLSKLEILDCSGNQLSSLDLSGLSELYELDCSGNQLSSLDISGQSGLWFLYCSSNRLSSLDLSGQSELICLYCSGNQLSSLDLSGLSGLRELACSGNWLSSLDISCLSELDYLDCSGNQLTSLDVSDVSPQFWYLDCSDNQLASLDVSGLSRLQGLLCSGNRLYSLDVSHLSLLEGLDCHDNQLTSLDLSNQSLLWGLDCSGNRLRGLALNDIAPYDYLVDVRHNYMKDTPAITGRDIDWDADPFYFSPQNAYNSVTGITGVPSESTAGLPLELTGVVQPAEASHRQITWSVLSDPSSTGAAIHGSTFTAASPGEVMIQATIEEGLFFDEDYTQSFTITVKGQGLEYSIRVNSGIADREKAKAGDQITITANPASTNQRFKEWTVQKGGITLTDPQSSTTDFIMPSEQVEVTAVYEDIPAAPGGPAEPVEPGVTEYSVIKPFAKFTGSGDRSAIIAGDYDRFVRLLLGGKAVEPPNYTAAEGSTVITLKESYLKTLANGTYSFLAEYKDGHLYLNLVVDVADEPVLTSQEKEDKPAPLLPKTGDKGAPWIWLGGVVLLVGVLLLTIIAFSKRKQAVKGNR